MDPLLRSLLAGGLGGFASSWSSWLITGVLFHRFQRATPATWRPEGALQYALSSVLATVGGAGFGLLYFSTGGLLYFVSPHWWLQGAAFGALLWLAVLLPALLGLAIFINLHRGVVAGLALDWLVRAILVGATCAWFA